VPSPGPPFEREWSYLASPHGDSYKLSVRVPNYYCPLFSVVPRCKDFFAYHSDGVYAMDDYGGAPEPIGRWAYYHQ
jgi:hypothetical protein